MRVSILKSQKRKENEKPKLILPAKELCFTCKGRDNPPKDCMRCRKLNREIKANFMEKKRDEVYRIIYPVWPEYLKAAKEASLLSSLTSAVIELAKNKITNKLCPWGNKQGLKVWNEVLDEIAIKCNDFYVPITKKNKTVPW